MTPKNQIHLHGHENIFHELVDLYNNNKLPSKILLSGEKGIGKCTLAYHLVNNILSNGEDYQYNIRNKKINIENRTFKLIQNNSNLNFILVDVLPEKKMIDISQIRNLINNLNKSSFNSKPRFVLIDNIEFLNINSVNALLKILEEPNLNIFFLLINNNKRIIPTLRSRCLNYKLHLTHDQSIDISNKIILANIYDLINKELLDYYFTPGKIFNLLKFSKENGIELDKLTLKDFLFLIIDKSYYNKDNSINNMIYDFIELFLRNKISFKNYELFTYFLRRIDNTKKFNLDQESLYIEFKMKILNA
tara:strand:+ start:4357 stop:5271 length:915 start_codon:yes stop_codon:yes gene_type:complete